MKILWISPPDMTTEPVIRSLHGHAQEIHRYHYGSLPVDRGMLDAADKFEPDLVLYIGSNDANLMAQIQTFQRLQKRAKTVLICHDASDKTWTNVLADYTRSDAFSLIVAIDGNDDWPKRTQDFTALTPIPAGFYRDAPPLHERLVPFGFAGGYSSPSRRDIVQHLRAHAGLVVPRRNEQYGSYDDYARFLLRTKIVLNVPWSGSDNAAQVKGRVLEAGHAGCVLLDHVESAARKWFKPGSDYVAYSSKEEAMELARRLLDNPDWMEDFAVNLHERVTSEHSASVFWSKVFRGVGLHGTT